jgi:hypothetical protein
MAYKTAGQDDPFVLAFVVSNGLATVLVLGRARSPSMVDSGARRRRGVTLVWVRVADWMIADGEVPVPRPGDVLEELGIRWRGEVSPAGHEVPDGLDQLTAGRPAEVTYRVTGRASEARDFHFEIDPGVRDHGTDFVLTVGTARFQVQCAGRAVDVPEGARVSVTGRAGVIGSYEWDDPGLPDVRADWRVTGVLPRDDGGVMLDLDP